MIAGRRLLGSDDLDLPDKMFDGKSEWGVSQEEVVIG